MKCVIPDRINMELLKCKEISRTERVRLNSLSEGALCRYLTVDKWFFVSWILEGPSVKKVLESWRSIKISLLPPCQKKWDKKREQFSFFLLLVFLFYFFLSFFFYHGIHIAQSYFLVIFSYLYSMENWSCLLFLVYNRRFQFYWVTVFTT